MRAGPGGIAGGACVVLVGLGPFLTYGPTAGVAPPWLVDAVILAQLAAIVWLLTRPLAILHRTILAAGILAAVAWALVYPGVPAGLVGLAGGGFCHAAAYAGLLFWFARSLRAGHEPVVTGLARQMRQTMPNRVVRYTRHVTIAWCVFFAAQLLVSSILLILAPERLWQCFVTLLNLPLIMAMMLTEFAVRWVLFRREARTGLRATLTGLRRIRGLSDGPARDLSGRPIRDLSGRPARDLSGRLS